MRDAWCEREGGGVSPSLPDDDVIEVRPEERALVALHLPVLHSGIIQLGRELE